MAKNIIVTDLDDTLVMSGGKVNATLKMKLIEKDQEGYGIVIVSGRNIDLLEETRKWLEDNNIPHQAIHLSDFPAGPNSSRAFKVYKAKNLIEDGYIIDKWYENDADTRKELRDLGIEAEMPDVSIEDNPQDHPKIEKIDNSKNINTNHNTEELKTMQTKTFKADIEVKGLTESTDAPYGSFTALVSVFNNVDLVNDRIIPGAFADSLADYTAKGKTLPIVWSHDWSNADSFIGKTLSAVETPEGLLISASFFNTPKAQHIRELLSERVVSEFSFAYDVVDQQKAKDGVNELLKLNILEAGPTLKGANPDTQLLVAKTAISNIELENAKAGRTLSTKNETRIKDAVNLLSEVLTSLENNSDNAKSEEAETLKVEEQTLDANLALNLLELEDLD